jgi:hypothetical protein
MKKYILFLLVFSVVFVSRLPFLDAGYGNEQDGHRIDGYVVVLLFFEKQDWKSSFRRVVKFRIAASIGTVIVHLSTVDDFNWKEFRIDLKKEGAAEFMPAKM